MDKTTQIIDLFEASRDALFNTTSKGDVPAPSAIEQAVSSSLDLTERLATSIERMATLKHIACKLEGPRLNNEQRAIVLELVDDLVNGVHVK